MEEWRAVIIDSLAMSCLNGHEISINDFTRNEENNGVYLNREGIKSFVLKYENKMHRNQNILIILISLSPSERQLSIRLKVWLKQ